MDINKDQELLWIAKESLKAPLPPDWKPCQANDDSIYYFNFKTGESVWDHPCDEYYRRMYREEKEKRDRVKGEPVGEPLSCSVAVAPVVPAVAAPVAPVTAPLPRTAAVPQTHTSQPSQIKKQLPEIKTKKPLPL